MAPGLLLKQWAAYPLRRLLQSPPRVSLKLTRRVRMTTAVELTKSILHLYTSPLLEEHWAEKDAYFTHRPHDSIASAYEHKFVYLLFQSTRARASERIIRNRKLFTLGILLIELLYGKTIEELQQPEDLDCRGTPGVIWCTTDRLVETQIEYESGPGYSDVVRRCVRCDFNTPDSDLDSEVFQRAVLEGVVTPLEKNIQQFISLE